MRALAARERRADRGGAGARRRRRARRAPADPRPPAHVPSARELELAHEVAALRERLAAAEAQIGARAWLRRRLGRSAPR